METGGAALRSRRVNLFVHVGGRFEGEGVQREYVGGEQIGWTVETKDISEDALLSFLGDLQFLNMDKISFLIPGKSLADGLLSLTFGEDAPYMAMVSIVSIHGWGHIYVEHVDGEVRREGVELPTEGEAGSKSDEQEEEVIEVDCLSDDDDAEVVAARSKKKIFLAKQGSYRIEGFDVDVDAVFDDIQVEIRRAKKAVQAGSGSGSTVNRNVELDYSNDEGSFYTGSSEDDCGEVRPRRRPKTRDHYDPNTDAPHICVGMVFDNRGQFKEAMTEFSIRDRRELKMTLNDPQRVQYKCPSDGCEFAIYASVDAETKEFVVRTFKDQHAVFCRPSFKNRLVTYKVLGKRFLSRLRIMPKMMAIDIEQQAKEELMVQVSYTQCRRAKDWALNIIKGRAKMEVDRLWDYALALKKASKGLTNTVEIEAKRPAPNLPLYFKRMFVCLDSCRLAFLDGCRPVLGLDGCFLKGELKGELLSAVARDANDQMYPVAWAYVEGENFDSWSWFLEELDMVIGMGSAPAFTIISDMQKGLEKAISSKFPSIEHRFCARHFFANWRRKHKGSELQRLFWSACKSTTATELEECIAKMRELKPAAVEDMLKKNSKHWCKAYFNHEVKCDVVDNNMSECFNATILEARHMSIISMMECIRKQVMSRIAEKIDGSTKWVDRLTTRIRERIERRKNASAYFHARPNGHMEYEVVNQSDTFCVDMENRTCTCNLWVLTGIPCVHACACILYRYENVDNYVSPWYLVERYKETYAKVIQPVPSSRFWNKTNKEKMLAPIPRKMPGQPTTKRRREEGESSSTYKRPPRQMTCKHCGQRNHNARGCPLKKSSKDQSQDPTNGPSATATTVEEVLGPALRKGKRARVPTSAGSPPADFVWMSPGFLHRKPTQTDTPVTSSAPNDPIPTQQSIGTSVQYPPDRAITPEDTRSEQPSAPSPPQPPSISRGRRGLVSLSGVRIKKSCPKQMNPTIPRRQKQLRAAFEEAQPTQQEWTKQAKQKGKDKVKDKTSKKTTPTRRSERISMAAFCKKKWTGTLHINIEESSDDEGGSGVPRQESHLCK